jgi:hypothetical protein
MAFATMLVTLWSMLWVSIGIGVRLCSLCPWGHWPV